MEDNLQFPREALREFWNGTYLIKKLYDRKLEPVCEKWKLTRMELDILLFLANNPAMDTAAHMIACRGFTKSHVSSALKALSEKKYIDRSFREGNRKTVHIQLLESCRPVVADGRKAQKEFGDALFSDSSEEERICMENFFGKLAKNARRELKEEETCCINL